MACALDGSASGRHAWRARPESPRTIANHHLVAEVRRIKARHHGRWGSLRMHAALRAQGHRCSRDRVERLKVEPVHQHRWATRDHARRDLFGSVEGHCNRARIHSPLGCLTPKHAKQPKQMASSTPKHHRGRSRQVRIVPSDKHPSDSAPTHRVFVGQAEIGAGWTKTSQGGSDYLALKLDDPNFAAPVYASLVEAEDGESRRLIWSRQSGKLPGRPPLDQDKLASALTLIQAAEQLGLGRSTLYRELASLRTQAPSTPALDTER